MDNSAIDLVIYLSILSLDKKRGTFTIKILFYSPSRILDITTDITIDGFLIGTATQLLSSSGVNL